MIDFHLTINQLELIGAICVVLLVALPFFKSALGGVRKQIGRMSLHAKILLGFCIVNSVIVCGTKTNDPPRFAGATLTGKAAILAAENTAAKMAALPVGGVSRFWSADADDGSKCAAVGCRDDYMGYSCRVGFVEFGRNELFKTNSCSVRAEIRLQRKRNVAGDKARFLGRKRS